MYDFTRHPAMRWKALLILLCTLGSGQPSSVRLGMDNITIQFCAPVRILAPESEYTVMSSVSAVSRLRQTRRRLG